MTYNQKLNIVRDCWWSNPSGTNYVTDENGYLSTLSHGLYKSLNSSDSTYIQFHGSGIPVGNNINSPLYFCRLETTNIVPYSINPIEYDKWGSPIITPSYEGIIVSARVSGDNDVYAAIGINGMQIGTIGPWNSISTQTKAFLLDSAKLERILNGRTSSNYDFFYIQLHSNNEPLNNVKLYNLEVYCSGDKTWNNYYDSAPNVITESFVPSLFSVRNSAIWSGEYSYIAINPASGNADNEYIEYTNYSDYSYSWLYTDWQKTVGKIGELMPNGGLSLYFDTGSIAPITQVTRAKMRLRMSLPPSGLYENARDCFEINGYNYLFKEQDNRDELQDISTSIQSKDRKFGYFVYGAGDIIEQDGFKTYDVELNFLDPNLPSGNISSTIYRNIDIFNQMEFQLVGIPSGTLLSSAELLIEYIPNDYFGLYTLGNVRRKTTNSLVDTGGLINPFFGNGGWHHIGNIDEGEIFDAFYNFNEASGHVTYPISNNSAIGAYGEYINLIPSVQYDPWGLPLLQPIETKEPNRKNYYRNPIRTTRLYDPTFYRNAIYNGSCFSPWHVHQPDVLEYSEDTTQIYFDDRIVLNTDFTLYFMLYRELSGTSDYSYGRIFQRGLSGFQGEEQYEIIGSIEPWSLKFSIKDTKNNTHQVSVPLPNYPKEPIMIWFTCTFANGETTCKLYASEFVDRYFSENWRYNFITFAGGRKQYAGAKTILGTLWTPETIEQKLSYNSVMNFITFTEFAWADEAIPLDYYTSGNSVINDYDVSTDKEKRFISSRVCNSNYLVNGSGINWQVPYGSGLAKWSTRYSITEWSKDGIHHSLYNPVSTAGSNNLVHPSAIYVAIEVENNTDHPSGLFIDCDLEFDTGSTDNWKVGRSSFNIPSGTSTEYISGISKHINMGSEPILFSDIDNIAVNITTKYVDVEDQEYYGDVNVKSITVYFDSFCVAATGVPNTITLYTTGKANLLNEDVDLFIIGQATTSSEIGDNNSLDLYIHGIPFVASGDIVSLYTNAENYITPPSNDPDSTKLNFFIKGLIPEFYSDNIEQYMWATPYGVGGMYKNTTLFIDGFDKERVLPLYIRAPNGQTSTHMNLYIENDNSSDNMIDLFVLGPSGINDITYLYIKGLGIGPDDGDNDGYYIQKGKMPLYIARDSEALENTIPLYIEQKTSNNAIQFYIDGVEVENSSIPLYLHGEGPPLTSTTKLYTHGF
jgi:hypothetical protein